jgi:hypothetical protein
VEEMSGRIKCNYKRSVEYSTEYRRQKIQALLLAKECYSMKLELLTNATVVDDAMRFVSQRSKEEVKSASNSNEDEKESREPYYDEDKDQLQSLLKLI